MRRLNRGQGDEGAVLVLALLFILATALLVTSVLTRTAGATINASVQREYASKRYAAEAGLEYAVQQLKSRPNLCPSDVGVNNNLLQPTGLLDSDANAAAANNPHPQVAVTCKLVSAADIGANGYGLITKDTSAAGLNVSGPPGEYLKIGGSVFISSLPVPLRFDVTEGDVVAVKPGACPAPKDVNLLLDTGYQLACLPTQGTAPDPNPTLPPAGLTNKGPNPKAKFGTCSAFEPGKYKNNINLSENNYFASGVYYFEDVDLTITKGSITGGAAAPQETKTTSSSCMWSTGKEVTDADVGSSGNGTGVKIILGGSSRIVAENPQSAIELFGRQAPVASAAGEGTQGVSLMTVTAARASADYKQSTRGFGDVVIGVSENNGGGGSKLELAVHGLTYAPDGLVQVRNNKAVTKFLDGLVAGRLEISTSANVGGFDISTTTKPVTRRIQITSKAQGAGGGDRVVTAVATATFDNATGLLSVDTWSVQ